MKVKISEIKVSAQPIRTSQDDDKLNELVQSIKEQGLIVPIKVRPDNGGYEVVYGHRRLEACKQAGLDEIESIIEGVDDTDTLIQALIENVVREDMNDLDEGKAYKELVDNYGLSVSHLGGKFGRSQQWIYRCIALANDPLASVHLGANIAETTRSILDTESRKGVLKKVENEGLSRNQTVKVTKAIVQAKTPEEKEALLETPIENPIFDRIVRAKARAKREINEQVRDKHFEKTQEVKEFLDSIFTFEKAIAEADEAIDFDKFSPEAAQFTTHRLDKLSEKISELVIRLMEK